MVVLDLTKFISANFQTARLQGNLQTRIGMRQVQHIKHCNWFRTFKIRWLFQLISLKASVIWLLQRNSGVGYDPPGCHYFNLRMLKLWFIVPGYQQLFTMSSGCYVQFDCMDWMFWSLFSLISKYVWALLDVCIVIIWFRIKVTALFTAFLATCVVHSDIELYIKKHKCMQFPRLLFKIYPVIFVIYTIHGIRYQSKLVLALY